MTTEHDSHVATPCSVGLLLPSPPTAAWVALARAPMSPAAGEGTVLGLALWQFGLVLVACNTFTTAVGLLLFKRSSDLESHRSLLLRPRFWCGIFFTVVVLAVTDSIAYSMTPLSLIAPFAGLTMVWSALLAHVGCFGFRERLTRTDVACTALVLAGVTLVTSVGAHGDPDPTVAELQADFSSPLFLCYAAFTYAAVTSWLAVSLCPCGRPYRPSPKSVMVTMLCAYCAAACASLTQVFMKVLSSAVRVGTRDGASLWREPLLYIAAGGLATSAPTQLYLLNSSLASSSVTLAVPAYQSLVIILTIATGGIFFQEFAGYTPAAAASFVAAVLMVMAGLAVLSYQHQERPTATALEELEAGARLATGSPGGARGGGEGQEEEEEEEERLLRARILPRGVASSSAPAELQCGGRKHL